MTERKKLVDEICKYKPCHGREAVEHWAAGLPEGEHTLRGVLTYGERLGVELVDLLWVAWRISPRDVREACVRRAVLRAARVHATGALERHGLHAHAAKLQALPDNATYPAIRAAAADAARAAYFADAAPATYFAAADAADAAADAACGYDAAYAAVAADAAAASAAYGCACAARAARSAERRQQVADLLELLP